MKNSTLVLALVAVWIVACTAQVEVNPIDYETRGDEIIVHTYPEVENNWPAAIEFCERHTKAAKTDPTHIIDICVNECARNPKQPWCKDLSEILNDQRRNSSNID